MTHHGEPQPAPNGHEECAPRSTRWSRHDDMETVRRQEEHADQRRHFDDAVGESLDDTDRQRGPSDSALFLQELHVPGHPDSTGRNHDADLGRGEEAGVDPPGELRFRIAPNVLTASMAGCNYATIKPPITNYVAASLS